MKFSIIIAHYQGTDTDEDLDRCISSIKAQSFDDYEIVLMHDGPLLRPCKYKINCTPERMNVWGHNTRDYALKNLVKGTHILHTNADNVYYPNALEILSKNLSKDVPICIMACKMMGFHYDVTQSRVWYDDPRDYSYYTTLRGTPKMGLIDLMQLCASKEVWQDMGGWQLQHVAESDGYMYEAMCKKYRYIVVSDIIGEHY